MAPRIDHRHIAYKVHRPDLDLWPIFGTFLLVVFVFAFALIVWQGRQMFRPTSHKTPTDRIVLIASPQPAPVGTPSPDPTSTPSPAGQLADTGPTDQPAAAPPARATTAPTPRPTPRPTPAPKPTATDRPPTAILNATPAAGPKGQSFTADASFSWDGDATPIVSYQFTWGDGLSTGPQASPTAAHQYNVAGIYVITVIVVDSAGLSSSAQTSVTVI